MALGLVILLIIVNEWAQGRTDAAAGSFAYLGVPLLFFAIFGLGFLGIPAFIVIGLYALLCREKPYFFKGLVFLGAAVLLVMVIFTKIMMDSWEGFGG